MLSKGTTCQDTVKLFKNSRTQQLLITDDNARVKGIVTSDVLLSKLISGTAKQTDCPEMVMVKQFTKVPSSTTLGKLSRIFEKESYAVVLNDDDTVVGIVNQNAIFDFITRNETNAMQNNGNAE